MVAIAPLSIKELPEVPPLKKLIGPSLILLGLGLGSGEVILWPYLTSHYGLGIIWGVILGITFQFFMNMEIERYTLAHGESIFVGLKRKLNFIPLWFLISTFIPWAWPGIAASSAALAGSLLGITNTTPITIGILILIGLILTLGPILYRTVETSQKILISIGVPSIAILALFLTKQNQWFDLAKGAVGIGPDYWLLPKDVSLASFLAALAFAGAGGNLNLAQSFYVKEKGYGMGYHANKISSLLLGKVENVTITGSKFEGSKENLDKFKLWWRSINIEHFLVFWLTGLLTILLLALLAYSTVYGHLGNSADISFVITEAQVIGQTIFPLAGFFFLIVAALTLFGTQLTVLDATGRILSENIILTFHQRLDGKHLSKIYYGILWVQILAGILILLLGFNQPLQLITLSAILNALAMFVHSALTLWLNLTSLDPKIRPGKIRISAMSLAFLFYGFFIFVVLGENLLQ